MTGQKSRIIRRFEREFERKREETKDAGITCTCGKCRLAIFTLEEIKEIIGRPYNE